MQLLPITKRQTEVHLPGKRRHSASHPSAVQGNLLSSPQPTYKDPSTWRGSCWFARKNHHLAHSFGCMAPLAVAPRHNIPSKPTTYPVPYELFGGCPTSSQLLSLEQAFAFVGLVEFRGTFWALAVWSTTSGEMTHAQSKSSETGILGFRLFSPLKHRQSSSRVA